MKDEEHIQRMLNKQYDFKLKQVLSRASELSSKNNWVLVQALLALIFVVMVMGFIFVQSFGIVEPQDVESLSGTQNALASLMMNVVLAPMFGGLAMIAIQFARGAKPNALQVFAYVSYILPLGVASLLISLAFELGLLLLILPAFYVFMATTFTLPLIIDKSLTPFSAIFLSIRMVNAYLFPMTQIFLIFLALFFGVIITFGFALIWVGPYFLNVRAILYTDLFCSNSLTESQNTGESGVFDA